MGRSSDFLSARFHSCPLLSYCRDRFFSNEVALAGGMPVLEKHLTLDQLSLAAVYTTNISLLCQQTGSEPGSHTPKPCTCPLALA